MPHIQQMSTIPTIRSSIIKTSAFVLLLWFIKSIEQLFNISFRDLGVYPQDISGLIGILFAPLIHGSYEHLASNTLSLMILGTILLFGYPKSAKWVIPIVWIASGIGVWIFARESYHVGASGLTHGIFFYLLITSILRRDKRSIALMMIAFFMYGGMVLSILPREQHISFEYHLFGAIAGIVCAALFYKWDPKLARKKYNWENEKEPDQFDGSWNNETDSNEDLVGEEWKSSDDSSESSSEYSVEHEHKHKHNKNRYH